jgi:hypothetical protein
VDVGLESPVASCGWRSWRLLEGLLGLSAHTFVYAEGFSYLSTTRAPVNCHVMREQYDEKPKNSHHAAARATTATRRATSCAST